MSFLHHDPQGGDSGAAKFVALTVAVLTVLGAVAYWFLRQAPEPALGTRSTDAPPPAVEREPVEEAEPETALRGEDVGALGSISVSSNVDGASVYLDEKLVGEAPLRREDIPAGRHRVRVESAGHEPFETDIRVSAGKRAKVEANLSILGPSLGVESDVPGSTVFLDRNYVGTTPVDIKNVSPGEHQITVSAEGYDMYAETLSVESGHRDIRVIFKNVSLAEKITVVHRHRIGSCEGTLVADYRGLRYETSNKSDAFSAPFSALEQFEVDYLDKNLNVKVRKGKNYNFAEKRGNADLLFVFHKNVEAFREKM